MTVEYGWMDNKTLALLEDTVKQRVRKAAGKLSGHLDTLSAIQHEVASRKEAESDR